MNLLYCYVSISLRAALTRCTGKDAECAVSRREVYSSRRCAPNDAHMLLRTHSTHSPRGQAKCRPSFVRSERADRLRGAVCRVIARSCGFEVEGAGDAEPLLHSSISFLYFHPPTLCPPGRHTYTSLSPALSLSLAIFALLP